MGVRSDFYRPVARRRRVGSYEVDEDGHVFRDGFELSLLGNGRYVNLCEGGETRRVKVAYLVARAFIPNMEMRPYVVHKDGDGSNNRVGNLEWSERREKARGMRGPTRARRVMCVTPQGDVLRFGSVTEAGEAMMVSRTGILACLKGKQMRCGGCAWYEIG